MRWNLRLFHWIAEKIFRHPEGNILPWYLIVVRWVVCPLDSFRWRMQWGPKDIAYDWHQDCFTIYGIDYHGNFFRGMSKHGVDIGRFIRIIGRESGMVMMQSYSPEVEAQFIEILEEGRS